jgi:hypothetical protein
MNKKFAGAALLMAMLFALTGCGKSQETSASAETQASSAQTETSSVSVAESSAEPEAKSEAVSTQDTATIDPAGYVGFYSNDGSDTMEISQAEDGSYTIEIALYRLWDCEKTELTADGDKLVFNSEDSSGQPIKGAVYPDGDQLVFELLDADWEYFKTGDKFTGFTLVEASTQDTATIDPADYVGYYNNEANDIMEISQADDGTYMIEIGLYKLWGCDKTELTADGDKLVFDSEDGSGEPIKGAVYPDGDQLVFELLDADWEYFKTGDKFTGFTLAE